MNYDEFLDEPSKLVLCCGSWVVGGQCGVRKENNRCSSRRQAGVVLFSFHRKPLSTARSSLGKVGNIHELLVVPNSRACTYRALFVIHNFYPLTSREF